MLYLSMPLRIRPALVAMIVATGAGLIIAGTFVPVNGGGDFGYRYTIFDRSLGQPMLLLVAIEPLAAAVASSLAALLLGRRAPVLTAGFIIAVGFQTFLFFLAYAAAAVFGDPAYDSFEPGGVLGALGAALVLAGGIFLVPRRRSVYRSLKRTRRSSPQRNAV
jgi:hypothetical protein